MALDRKPRVGDLIQWPGDITYHVTEVRSDGIAWIRPITGGDATCFIYRFRAGWNRLASFVDE